MKILVTGASGYLGSSIAEYLKKNNSYKIFRAYSKKNLSNKNLDNHESIMIDWDCKKNIFEACQDIDTIIHTVGLSAKDCADNPVDAEKINCLITKRLIDASKKSKVKKLIFLSTAHVYKSPLEGFIDENTNTDNSHPYAMTNRHREKIVMESTAKNQVKIILRLSNVFGAPIYKKSACWNLFINEICKEGVCNGKITLKNFSNIERDFLPISEFNRVIDFFVKKSFRPGCAQIYNVGFGKSITLFDTATMVARIINEKFKLNVTINKENSNKIDLAPLEFSQKKLLNDGFKFLNGQVFNNELEKLITYVNNNFKD